MKDKILSVNNNVNYLFMKININNNILKLAQLSFMSFMNFGIFIVVINFFYH